MTMEYSDTNGGAGGSDEVLLLLGENNSNNNNKVIVGVVDYKGRKVIDRYKYGRWKSAGFVIGCQITESFAICGISSNLMNYLTGPLGQSTTSAAENINVWAGVASLLPLLGAFVADSYLGRFRTIFISSIFYLLGLGLLALSAVLPSSNQAYCSSTENTSSCPNSTPLKLIIFYSSLYIIAIAQGGYKPCLQTFAADQFDGRDIEESKYRSSFFNWWFFALCLGNTTSILILNYFQDSQRWGLSFGISCISIACGLVIFLVGTKSYRYSNTLKDDETNHFFRVCQVFIVAAKNWKIDASCGFDDVEEENTKSSFLIGAHHQFKFLDKALIPNGSKNHPTISLSQVEEAKAILRLVPIWACCLIYGVVFGQASTFFTKQGNGMDRSITQGFKIPAASLQSFIGISIVLFLPIYDRIFVPIATIFTGKTSGITMLQRIGCGMVLSVISMVVAAIVEQKRLQTALKFGVVDMASATVPMSIWWLIPQYVLFGLADVFALVGLQEFFYDQVPDQLRSVGVSFYLSILGIGSLLSGAIVSIIENVTSMGGRCSWFSDNLDGAHLDFYYWLLAGLSIIEFAAYLYFSQSYVYKRK